MSAFAQRALIVTFPPDPRYGGRPPGDWAESSRRAKSRSVFVLLPGHWALRRRKVRYIPDAQEWASVMPLPCVSSPHRTRFAGLRRGPQLGFSNVHRLVRQSRGSWSVIGRPAGRHPQRQSEALHKVLCQAFFQESGPPDGTQGPIGRVFKSGGPPGRGGPAVGPWARPGASIAARRRPGRTAALPLRLSSYAAGSCPVPPVFESEESS